MPDMHAVFQHAASPPKVDLASANSQLFQLPSSASASSSLYSLSLSRKRPRRDTGNLSSKFDLSPEVHHHASPLPSTDFRPSSGEEYLTSAEVDYRPNRYRESFLPPSLDASVDSIVADESNHTRKRSRRDSNIASPPINLSSPSTVGWGRTMINVVGKVFDFCWSGAFKGFYAGGGQGYDVHAGPSAAPQYSPNWQAAPSSANEKERIFSTPIPGQYPEEDIDCSWVVVRAEAQPADPFGYDGPNDNERPSTLRTRRIHQASSPRRRQAVMPRLNKRPNSSMRPSTPSKGAVPPSPRSQNGPGSAEMLKYEKRMRRKEREEDASYQRLNMQLEAMIRQGKEALGTTVEVNDMDMDFQSD